MDGGPIFLRSHPILAVGPQNVGMNQKGIGPRRPLHDSQRNTGEGERGRSLGGRRRKYGHDKLVVREVEGEGRISK